MNNTIQRGYTLDLTAPGGGVVSGQGYVIGSLFAVAGNGPIAAGEKFPGVVVGVVDLTKATGQVWAEGDVIYWDDSAKEASNVGGDQRIGAASASALGPAATGAVRLDGVAGAAIGQDIFVSAQQTGTGAAQNVAHGLGVVPSAVSVQLESGHNGAGAVGDLTPLVDSDGAHDATNAVVTVTSGAKFKVTAYR